jgi:acyl-coenzyme A synthetase/AMP-(fatty) acid ligase
MGGNSWWGVELLNHTPGTAIWALAQRMVSYAQLRDQVAELAVRLRTYGVGPGSTVAVQVPPSLTLVYAMFALWSCGAQVLLVDHRQRPAEDERLLRRCRPQYRLRVQHDSQPIMVQFRDDYELVIEERPDGLPARGQYCLAHCSSGATGQPKVIGRTGESLLSEVDRLGRLVGIPQSGERVLVLSSLIHAFGLIVGVLHGLYAGTTLVFTHRARPSEVLQLAAQTGVHVLFAVPAQLELLAIVPAPPPLPKLRRVVTAGERLTPDMWQRFLDRYGVPIGQIYGMTEVGVIAVDLLGRTVPPEIGPPAPGIDVRVDDGELYVRMDSSP